MFSYILFKYFNDFIKAVAILNQHILWTRMFFFSKSSVFNFAANQIAQCDVVRKMKFFKSAT